jgi:hypothetical protein
MFIQTRRLRFMACTTCATVLWVISLTSFQHQREISRFACGIRLNCLHLLKDNDLTTLGYSGWLRYPIVRAAKYALDKEEGSDTSKLDQELAFLKLRIEQTSQNRDAGVPDTISNTRQDPLYGGMGFGGGSQGGW